MLIDSRASPRRAAVVAVASTELGASAPRGLADHPRNDCFIEVDDESAAASCYTARSPITQESAHSRRLYRIRVPSELCHGMRPSQVAPSLFSFELSSRLSFVALLARFYAGLRRFIQIDSNKLALSTRKHGKRAGFTGPNTVWPTDFRSIDALTR